MENPVEKASLYLRELHEYSVHIPEIRLRRIVADCKQILAQERTSSDLGDVFTALAWALFRLDKYDESVQAFRNAARMQSLDPDSWSNLGVALIQINELDEAQAALDKCLKLASSPNWLHLANYAELMWRRGNFAELEKYIHKAELLVPLNDPDQAFLMAAAAAGVRHSGRATLWLAKYFSLKHGAPMGDVRPIDFIENAPGDWWSGLDVSPSLHDAVEEVRRGAPKEMWNVPEEDEDLSDEETAALHRIAERRGRSNRTPASDVHARFREKKQ